MATYETKTYHLPPTPLIPNNPYPLIHYKRIFTPNASSTPCTALSVYDIFTQNGWQTQWIHRYGATQDSHYHAYTHEAMVVLNGHATIRFGSGDLSPDTQKSTWGDAYEKAGVTLEAEKGDVFIIPAGVSHKTHNTSPERENAWLTPDGHVHREDDPRGVVGRVADVDGFVMMGTYPEGFEWDSHRGGEGDPVREEVWGVPKPPKDPVLGTSEEGLVGLWQVKSAKA